MHREPRRSDPMKAAAEAQGGPGGVGTRAAKVISSFAGAYYFDGIGQAIQGGLWCAPMHWCSLVMHRLRPQRPLLISQMRPGNPEACSTGTGDFRLRAAGRRTIRRATPCWLWRRTGRASTWCRRAWPMWRPFPARLSSMISARAAS